MHLFLNRYTHLTFHNSGSGCFEGDIQIGTSCLRRLFINVTWHSGVMACHNLGYELIRFNFELLYDDETFINERNIWLDEYRDPLMWNTVKYIQEIHQT